MIPRSVDLGWSALGIDLSLSYSGEEKTRLPKFIIPAAGGAVTVRAITEHQVAGISSAEEALIINDEGEVSVRS